MPQAAPNVPMLEGAAGMRGAGQALYEIIRKRELERLAAQELEFKRSQETQKTGYEGRRVATDEGMLEVARQNADTAAARPPTGAAGRTTIKGVKAKDGRTVTQVINDADGKVVYEAEEAPSASETKADAAAAAAASADAQSAEDALAVVRELRAMPGQAGAVGAPEFSLTGIGNAASDLFRGRPLDGTPQADYVRKIDQLKAALTLPKLKSMKGLGALSDMEGKRIADAATALSRAQSEAAFNKEMDIIESTLLAAQRRSAAGQVKPMLGHTPTGAAPAPAGGGVIDAAAWLAARPRGGR